MNAAKSTLPQAGPQIEVTITVTDAGGGKYKSVTEASVAGQSYKVEITFAIDGKDYAPVVTPAPPGGTPSMSQSYERVSAKSYKSAAKLNGQVLATSTSEVSADGKVDDRHDDGRRRRRARTSSCSTRSSHATTHGSGLRR